MNDEEDVDHLLHIYVEDIQGQLYAWEEETHVFLGQGATKQALFDRICDQLKLEGRAVFMVRLEPDAA